MSPKMKPPVQKNDDLVVTIESLTNEGQGVARVEGYAVFVIGALAGEQVKAHVIKVMPSYAIAKAIEIIKPSPDRVAPPATYFRSAVDARSGTLAIPRNWSKSSNG